MPNRHGSFVWYELLTADASAAKSFYDEVVGWDIEATASNPMNYRMIRTASGKAGGVMELTDNMREHGAKPTWLGYVGVDDVDVTVAKAVGLGAKVMMPAFDVPDVGRLALIADPQGIPIYVMRGASAEDSNAFSPEEHGHGAWNELSTTDLDAAKRFYTELFGWTLGDVMPDGRDGRLSVHRPWQRDDRRDDEGPKRRPPVLELLLPHRQRRPRLRSGQGGRRNGHLWASRSAWRAPRGAGVRSRGHGLHDRQQVRT
jgi:predicted enzyme related to lactoylglutathione lyase